ncbi:MAG: DUF937 domain-containing protein [Gemmatimonadales bacterium]|nr:DUF937 domain-containing protein [Gemmatimonadales bacterium]
MSSITEMVQQHLGDKGLAELSQHLGVDHGTAQTAIAAALPALVGALSRNAGQAGAAAMSPAASSSGIGGILGGVLGGRHEQVKQEVSRNSGLDIHQVEKALLFLAPIVMAQLAKQRQHDGVAAPADQAQQPESGSGGLLGMIERIFHRKS